MKRISFLKLRDRVLFGEKQVRYQLIEKRHHAAMVQKKDYLSFRDKLHLLQSYFSHSFFRQFTIVAPVCLYLLATQMFVFHHLIKGFWGILFALFFVCLGLMMFMDGLKFGLMPFAESIGHKLPRKSSLMVMLFFTFLIGIATTFSEPAIGALQAAGSIVQVKQSPFLYSLLNQHTLGLMLVVGMGVGFASVLGVLRFAYDWSLKPLIFLLLIPGLGLTIAALYIPSLKQIYSLAWDCGAVTTGPVTVPIILALGVGISSAIGKSESSLSGFGIVTLASLLPVIVVILYCAIIFHGVSAESIIASSINPAHTANLSFLHRSPYLEMVMGVRAVVPLVLLLFFIFFIVMKEQLTNKAVLYYGLIMAVIGMIVFNVGLTYGLSYLGQQIGQIAPSAYTSVPSVNHMALYGYLTGIAVVLFFVFFLGFGATIAEPALNALGITVETLTNGVMRKMTLIYCVAGGVGSGLLLGALKIIFNISLAYLIVPFYLIALILTLCSTEEVVNVAWDSAGVTTGPITVPLVLACGLGFGASAGALDGFALLAMASVCPIIAVMVTALISRYRARQYLEEK